MTPLAYRRAVKEKKLIRVLIAFGYRLDEISKILKLDQKTLRTHFRRDLEIGQLQANARVMGSIYQAATECSNMTAAIFWAKSNTVMQKPRSEKDKNDGPPPLLLKVQ